VAGEPEDKWADSNPLIGPGPEGMKTPAPPRSWGEAAIDTGLNLTAGVVGAGRQVLGAVEAAGSAIAPNAPGTIRARQNLDTAADIEGWIKSGRSEQEQQVEREGGYSFSKDPGKYLFGAGVGMIPYAPLAMMGPYGVPVAMALGAGQVRSDLRENIRNAPIEEMRKNPQYVDLRDQGLDDGAARERLAVESTDPRKMQTWLDAAPNMIGQGLTSGFGSAVIKGLSMPAMRGIKNEIVERVIEGANKSFIRGRATGVGMGAASGAALGAGSDLSRQLSEQTAGQQRTPVNWGQTKDAALETGALFAGLGLGYRRPERFRKAAAPPIDIHVEAAARDMAGDDLGTTPGPWGERPMAEGASMAPATGGERPMEHGDLGMPTPPDVEYGPAHVPPGAGPWGTRPPEPGPEMHPSDAGSYYPGTAPSEVAAQRREQRQMGGMPAITDLPGTRPPVEPGPPMHEGDIAPHEYGYPEPFARPAVRPKRGLQPMDEADVARVPSVAEGYPGLEEASIRTTAPFVPKKGSETFTGEQPIHKPGEPHTVPDLRPKPILREPKGGPEFPAVETPDLPGAGDFPHEPAAATSWRGGPAQRHIDEHLAGRDMATRGQIARALAEQTGKRSVGRLNKAMQQTLSKIRDVVDRALEHDAEGTIEAIRGGATEVGVRKRLDADEKQAVTALREGLEGGRIRTRRMLSTETTQGMADRIGRALQVMADHTPGVLAKNLPPTLEKLLKVLSPDQRVEVRSAIRTNAREVADMLQGREHKAEPGQWIHEDQGKAHRKEARAEEKAKAEAEGELLTKEEPADEPGHRPMVERDFTPEPKTAHREMVTRDIHPAPDTLGLSSEKVAARARRDAGKFKGRGLQAIEEANQMRLDRLAKAGRVVGQQRAMTEQGEASTVTSRKPTIVQRKLKAGEKPVVETAPAPPPTRPSRPSRVLPTLARAADVMEADRIRGLLGRAAAIKARMKDLQRKAEAAEGKADQASGRVSRAAFLKAAQESRDAMEKLQKEYERLGTAEYEAEVARDLEHKRARALGQLRDVVADNQTTQMLYDKMEDMLKRARDKYEKSQKTQKKKLQETDAQRKAEERKPTYTQRNLISENTLKVADPKERQAEIEKLDDIVTGRAETTTERAEAPDRKKGQTTTSYRKVDDTSALLPDDMTFITASLEGLKRIAKALAERAQEKIDLAEEGYSNDIERRVAAGEPNWNIRPTVGTSRGPHGLYYNHLVMYRRFIRAVNQFKGSKDMLRTMILNHYMAERLVMEGKSHKLKQLHDDQMNFLRQLAVERYNTVRNKADSSDADKAMAKKALDAFNRELDDALSMESLDEVHHSIPSDTNFLELLEEQGIEPGAISREAAGVLKRFVEKHNEDLLRDMEINERRRIEDKREIQPYDVEMAKIHGKEWYDADDTARMEMIDDRAMQEELGGKDFEKYPPRTPATGPRIRDLEGPPEAGVHREAVPGDLTQSWQEQVKLTEAMDRPPSTVREGTLPAATRAVTREHAARNLTPEARELRERIRLEAAERGQLDEMMEQEARATARNARVATLMERADQIVDNLETLPPGHRDAIWETELRLIEDELRQHYEESVPGAKKNEHGIGQVLEDGSDLTQRGNLPRGAYVRRVSDFLKAGERDIRKAVGGLMYNLRTHLMDVADAAVGNMEVVALTGEQMRLAADARRLPHDTPAFYDRETHRIIVSQEVLNRPDRAKILGHEITHPLTLRAMELLPDMRKKLEQQLQHLRDAYNDLRNPKYDELRRVIDQDPQMIANIHEMIAQLYNDGGKTAWALNQIEPPIETSMRWRKGLQGNLQAVFSTIRGGLNDLLFKVSKKKLLNDTLLTTLDAFNDLQRVGEFQRPKREGGAMPYTPDMNFSRQMSAEDLGWDQLGTRTETPQEKHDRLAPLWDAGPQNAMYTMRGRNMIPDLLKFIDKHARESWAQDYRMMGEALRSFQHLVDDVKIHILDNNDFNQWVKDIGGDPAAGIHMDVKNEYIVLPKDYDLRIAVHELAHAASVRALNEHPEFAAAIKDLAARLQNSPEYAKWKREMGLHGKVYGFTNAKEFVAEFYSNWQFRELTKRIKMTPAEVKEFTGVYVKKTLYQLVTDTIAKFLRKVTGDGQVSVEQMTGALLRGVLERQAHLRDWDKNARMALWDAHADLNVTRGQQPASPGLLSMSPANARRGEAIRAPTVERKVEAADSIWKDTAFRLKQMGISGAMLKASTFVDLRRRAEQGMQDVVRYVEDAYSKIETTAKRYFANSGAEDIARAIAEQMKMTPKHFQKLQDYVSKENHYRVSGSEELYVGRNAWVSKDSPYHEHYRKRHAELKADWNRLTPEQQSVRNRVLDYYGKRHGEILDKNLRMVIKMREMASDRGGEDALVKHIMRETLTDAEKTKLEGMGWRREGDTADMTAAQTKFRQQVNELRGSPLFKKIQGVWYPSERRGQWVVEGRYDLSKVAERYGGRKIDEHGGEWEFATDAQAQAFYREVTRDYDGIHHEGTTQHVYKADKDGKLILDAEGNPVPETVYSERTSRTGEPGEPGYTETTKGAERRISAKEAAGEPGTVTRHRVEFNPLLLEFYENQRHAHERHGELQGDEKLTLSHVTPKRDTTGTYLDPKKASRTTAVLMDALERSPAWERLDTSERRLLSRDLNEAATRHIMSQSARSQRIPRRYAMGADKSLLRDFNDYSRNTSMTLAEMEHRPALSKALKDMDDYVRSRKHWTDGGDEHNRFGTLRAKLQSEVHNRVFTRAPEALAPAWTKVLSRILQLTYMDKLMSPGFIVLNASEPWVLGLPLLSGPHGFGRSMAEIGRAYAAIGFHGLWGKGGVDAYRAAVGGVGTKFEDNHALLRDRVKGEKDGAALQQLLDYGGERGYLDRDAGMELAQRLDPSTSRTGKVLDHIDNVTRQVNQQVENVNRAVIAIAAYRLALPKMGHEKAMQHAFEMVHDVSGNYGHWNTPAMFNDPRLKMMLQFKRYSQRIVANYFRMIANSWNGATPEIKASSRKQLAIMLGSQVVLSGALGLPTEPLKAALLVMQPFTGFGPDEAEVWAREAAAKLIGNEQIAEAVMRGVPRAFGDIGIGTRLGHDSLLTHGTLGKKPDNWFSLVGHTVLGASGGTMADWAVSGGKMVDAVGNFVKGNTTQGRADLTEAAQLAIPFKLMSDSIGAFGNFTGGPKTMTPAGQPLGYQPNFAQALLEASGIRSGTQQEAGDKRFAISQAKAQYTEGRTKILQMYVRASTPGEKRSIQDAAMKNFNANWPKEMALNRGDFYKAEQRFRHRQSADPGDVGIHLSKKQQGLRDRFSFFTV